MSQACRSSPWAAQATTPPRTEPGKLPRPLPLFSGSLQVESGGGPPFGMLAAAVGAGGWWTASVADEDTLKANEAKFRAIVEKSLGAVTLSRADGTRLYASAAVAALLGYTPAEFLRLTRHEQVHPDDRPRIERELGDLLQRPG